MRRILQVFYIIFSAFIFSMATQNELLLLGSPFLGLFSLVPLYLALRNSKSFLESSLLTGLQTMTVHLISSFWLGNFRDFAIFTLGASAIGTGVIGMIFGCFFYYIMGNSTAENCECDTGSKKVTRRIFLFAAIWTMYEWAKSSGFLAYPWGTLIMTSYKWSLLTQIVAITGTWGISFLFSLFSAVVAEGIYLIPKSFKSSFKNTTFFYSRCGVVCILIFMITILYGTFEYTKKRTPIKTMQTVMVQQNMDSWNGGTDSTAINISAKLTNKGIDECIKATNNKPDLIVWSEAVISYAFPEAENYYRSHPSPTPLIPFIQKTNIPFIIGAPVTINKEKRQFGNATIFFDKDGNYLDYYAKMQLVPFAEIIPGTQYEWVRKIFDTIIGFSSGWTQGTKLTLFDIPLQDGDSVKISTPICFEDAFPPVCRALYLAGSEVFVNLTNDSWSMTKSAEYQHFAIASFRAIEYRTTLLRSTNSGYSVVVDPVGKVLYDLPLFEAASLYAPVPVYEREKTFYAIFGDWFPNLIRILLVLGILIEGFKKIKESKK